MEYTIKIYPNTGNAYTIILDVPVGVPVNDYIDNWLDENTINVEHWEFA